MNQLVDRIYDDTRSAWRFRWLGLGVAAAAALIGWIITFAIKDTYEARASVFVNTSTALKPVLQGLAVEQDVNVQLNYVRQSLLSGEPLERIARGAGVLTDSMVDPRLIAGTLDDFAKRVQIDVRSANPQDPEHNAGTVYTFTYRDPSRARALKATETIFRTFIDETLGGKREGAAGAQKFLAGQIKDYEQRLRLAENRLAEFKKSNIGLMPTEQGGYFTQLQTELDAAKKAENDLGVVVARRAELAKQLRGEAVIGAVAITSSAGGGMAGGGDTVSRIKEAQARLDDLLLRFTDKHPDVVAARATLAELQARRTAEIESLRRGDAGAVASSGVSSNPVYQNIVLQLNQADVEIASLRGQLGQHRAKAGELRQRLDTAPQVEAQYAQLNRDYDVNKAQYTALLANYEKAALGERADSAGSVQFEIVEPATAPFGPVAPQRLLLLVGVLVGALALGGGLCYVLHLLNPVVGSVRTLTEFTNLPVLGVVSPAFPHQHWKLRRQDLLHFGLAVSAILVVFVAAVILQHLGVRLGPEGAG